MKRHKLIALRGEKSLTSIAKDLGITRQMLGAIESGKRTPSLTLALRISQYYGVSVEEIFFDTKGHIVLPKQQPTGTEGR